MPTPALDKIQLLTADAITQTPVGAYTGDWVVHLPAITSPPGDGSIKEVDFTVPHPTLTGIVVGFYVSSSDGLASHWSSDQVLDTTALPAWCSVDTYVSSVHDWGEPTTLSMWNNGFGTNYDLSTSITVDTTNSAAAWYGWAGPHITSFTPDMGMPGTKFVLTGVGFTGTTQVAIPGTPLSLGCTFTVDSDTQITAVIDAPKNPGIWGMQFTVAGTTTYWAFQNFTVVADPILATGTGAGSLPVTCSIGATTDAIQVAFLSLIGGTLDMDVTGVQDTTGPVVKQPTGSWQVVSFDSSPHSSYILARTPGAADTVNLPVLAAGRWYAFGNIHTLDSIPDPWLIGTIASETGTAFETTTTAGAYVGTGRQYLAAFGARFSAINSPTAIPAFPTPVDIDTPVGSFALAASEAGYFAPLDAGASGSASSRIWFGDTDSPSHDDSTLSTAGDGYASAVTIGTRPANDDFVNAETIAGSTIVGSNMFATREPDDPPTYESCSGMIWYRWDAPASGSVSFSSAGSVFEGTFTSLTTELIAYTGTTLAGLVEVAHDVDAHPPSVLTFDAITGTTYWIRFNGFAWFDRGDVELGITFTPAVGGWLIGSVGF